MKKSQIYSHIFIYILTIILISFILVYGYNAVQNFRKRAEQVACLKFKSDLSNAIDSILSDFGSVKIKDFQLCSGYTKVCFVETFYFKNVDKDNPTFKYIPADPLATEDPIIKDSIKSENGKNTFLVEDIAKESFYIGNISVEPDHVLCIKAVNQKISLKLEGKGNHVLLS